MKIFTKTGLWRGLTTVFVSLFVLLIILTFTGLNNAGQINGFLKVQTSIVEQRGDGEKTDTAYFKSAYGDVNNLTADDYNKLLADEYKHAVNEQEEGSVLLKNDNAALPLKENNRKVTLFGHATVDPYYKANSGGTWSGKSNMLLTYEQAMKNAGFEVNQALIDAYKASGTSRGGNPDTFGSTSYDLAEEPAAFYTDSRKATFDNFNNAAIVMLARTGGEERDLPFVDYEGINHLSLHKAEKDLLAMIRDSGKFEKTILLINSGNALEVDFLDEYEIDAALWIGGPGFRGFEGVANILKGNANPSGKLVDTYAANAMSSPAIVNAGDFNFSNADKVIASCTDSAGAVSKTLVYAEGIYVGYRYYETRYEDAMLGRYGASDDKGSTDGSAWSYADEVCYPFGYGLSYTTFEQTLENIDASGDKITATITVKNTGTVAGKCVVELYAQTPYEEYEKTNKVEKSAIQLIGFAKTEELVPDGQAHTVTITADKYLLASYDYMTLKGYYLSEGDYYFAIGNGAHEALNNVLAQKKADGKAVGALVDHDGKSVSPDPSKTVRKWQMSTRDETSYKASNNVAVTNRFEDVDLNHWQSGAVEYLTRSDWSGTYPVRATSVTATAEMIRLLDGHTYTKPANAPAASSFNQGDRSDDIMQNLKLVDMRTVDYGNALWDEFLDQLTVYEMTRILIDAGGTTGIEPVAKPEQINQDGPDGAKGPVKVNNNAWPMCYPNETVLSSTWNIELVEKRGEFLGEDCLFGGVTQLWSPGGNLHRTPFSGRNFEYYSEDPTLSYLMIAVECKAMEAKGVSAAPKHLAVNDQETNRHGVATFLNEQTMREIYLRAFEGAFTKGGATGTMTSYNRIGCTYVGASSALQQEVLRGEWDFKGAIISDMVGSGENYQHTIESLIAGTDMFCMAGNYARADALLKTINSGDGDGYLLQALRNANHNFYYTVSHHNLINGLDSNSVIKNIMPWWQVLLIVIDVVLGVLALSACAMFLIGAYFKKKEMTNENL